MSPGRRTLHETFMRRALEVAAESPGGVDVPVGAVVFGPDGSEIGYGVNERELHGDPTAMPRFWPCAGRLPPVTAGGSMAAPWP
jgi:hypothetical protein